MKPLAINSLDLHSILHRMSILWNSTLTPSSVGWSASPSMASCTVLPLTHRNTAICSQIEKLTIRLSNQTILVPSSNLLPQDHWIITSSDHDHRISLLRITRTNTQPTLLCEKKRLPLITFLMIGNRLFDPGFTVACRIGFRFFLHTRFLRTDLAKSKPAFYPIHPSNVD